MKRITTFAILLAGMAVPATADTLEFDPMLGWITAGGVGQGRSAYFRCNEAISLTHAAFMCDMPAGSYDVIIYQGAGEFALPGPILTRAVGQLGGIGMNWQEMPITFDLEPGQEYILHFRSSTPGAQVATTYERFFWGDQPGQDLNLGVVTIMDGREGYDAGNWSNVAFPRMRITFDAGGQCYADCDTQSGPGILDIFDFLCFGNRFAANDPYACDCDTSTGVGVCDIFDFLCFGNEFQAGCP